MVLRGWEPVSDHSEVSWASDGCKEVLGLVIFTLLKIKLFEGSCHVVEEAWSCENFFALRSVGRFDLEASFDDVLEVKGKVLWDWIVDASGNFLAQPSHACGSEWRHQCNHFVKDAT